MSLEYTKDGYVIVPIDWELTQGDQRDILMAQRNGKASAVRTYDTWTGFELNLLERAFLEGDGLSYLAVAFQRSEYEIVDTLKSFGLLTPKGGRAKYDTFPPRMQMCEYCKGPGCPFFEEGDGICHGDPGTAVNPFSDYLDD